VFGTDASGGEGVPCDGTTDIPWGPLNATLDGENIVVDFSPKGGPSDLSGVFDAVYGVEHAEYLPKPEQGAYDLVFGADDLKGGVAAMFEDEARNLAVPYSMGMRTVHVAPTPQDLHYVDFHTDDLNGFLGKILN
jgi:hypothetical protein